MWSNVQIFVRKLSFIVQNRHAQKNNHAHTQRNHKLKYVKFAYTVVLRLAILRIVPCCCCKFFALKNSNKIFNGSLKAKIKQRLFLSQVFNFKEMCWLCRKLVGFVVFPITLSTFLSVIFTPFHRIFAGGSYVL